MADGLRAVCSCGTTFALPREAFFSGMSCPGCGHEVTRAELEAYRPPGVTEFTRKSSIVILAAHVLGQLSFLARGFFGADLTGLAKFFRDLG